MTRKYETPAHEMKNRLGIKPGRRENVRFYH
jgi:hypothetical protein